MIELPQEPTRPMKAPASLPSPGMMLKQACLDAKRHSDYIGFFSTWPNLQTAGENLAVFLTPLWPNLVSGGWLLQDCLKSGLSQAKQARNNGEDDMGEQIRFIHGVLDEAVKVVDMTLMMKMKGSWTVHNPLQAPYLGNILKSGGCTKLHWVDEPYRLQATAGEIRLLCATRLFSFNEMRIAGIVGAEEYRG